MGCSGSKESITPSLKGKPAQKGDTFNVAGAKDEDAKDVEAIPNADSNGFVHLGLK